MILICKFTCFIIQPIQLHFLIKFWPKVGSVYVAQMGPVPFHMLSASILNNTFWRNQEVLGEYLLLFF